MISLIFFTISAGLYGIISLINHGKFKYQFHSENDTTFWGEGSWFRKYKSTPGLVTAPDTWYYRFFDIRYQERFPLSATALVFVTDGMHLTQFLMIKTLILSIITFHGIPSLTTFFIYLVAWSIGFNATYKLFAKWTMALTICCKLVWRREALDKVRPCTICKHLIVTDPYRLHLKLNDVLHKRFLRICESCYHLVNEEWYVYKSKGTPCETFKARNRCEAALFWVNEVISIVVAVL